MLLIFFYISAENKDKRGRKLPPAKTAKNTDINPKVLT